MSDDKVKLVLCWHMHQPNYYDTAKEEYILPWTYLHIIKDYVDMAAHLEECEGSAAVVNFVPILLEQIDDYSEQISGWVKNKSVIRDPLLAALGADSVKDYMDASKYPLVQSCLRANEDRLINRFPAYKKLAKLARFCAKNDGYIEHLNEQFLSDLLVWYNIVWMAETVKRENELVKKLIAKNGGFSREDRFALLSLIGDLSSSVIPRYRKLAESGRVELSFTPYTHPIIPLLLDFNNARQAVPGMLLPKAKEFPGGEERVRWQYEEGLKVFEAHFGFKPKGCWPSEGGVSDDMLGICEEMGVEWLATGESVLHNSLRKASMSQHDCIHHSYHVKNSSVNCFFRDDGLSDQIGFNYSSWHADDAVNNLIHHVENIAATCNDRNNAVISIILDGENAWEYYPENGYYFLNTLYDKLSSHAQIQLTTFSQCNKEITKVRELPSLTAGSWVHGTFSTWMGDPEKNHGWDLLCEAKHVYDRVMAGSTLDVAARELATKQLAICEGSDWFWWFGDYNPSDSVKDFDDLYRKHLQRLYELLKVPIPEVLYEAISAGGGDPAAGGVMRQGSESA